MERMMTAPRRCPECREFPQIKVTAAGNVALSCKDGFVFLGSDVLSAIAQWNNKMARLALAVR